MTSRPDPGSHDSGSSPVVRHSCLPGICATGFRHVAALAVAGLALAQPAATPPPDEEDIPEVPEPYNFDNRAPSADMMERLNLLAPQGRSHEGVRYPVYEDNVASGASSLKSLVECKRVTRTDETHFRFEGAVFSSFGNAQYPDAATRVVSLKDAEYDLQHSILSSDAPVQIDDRSTRVRGGSVIHDHVTGLTVFKKGFELYVSKEPEPPPAPSESSEPAPPPKVK